MERGKFNFNLLILLCISSVFAQEYKIEDFLPDSLTTWQIHAVGSLSGSFEENKYEDHSSQISKIFSSSPAITFNYSRIRPKSENNIHINGDISLYGRDYNDQYLYNNRYNLYIENQNRYYFRNKIGLSFPLSAQYRLYKDKENYDSYNTIIYTSKVERRNRTGSNKTKNQYYTISIHPGIFRGRIYDGSYAAKAMELIDELQKNNLLIRELSEEEYKYLSKIVMQRKAIYHYDSRIKKMEAMDEIVSYLKSIDVIDENSHQAVLIIEDIYSYSLNYEDAETRKFGFKIYTNFIGELSKSISTDINDLDIVNNRYSIPYSNSTRFNQTTIHYSESETTKYDADHVSKGIQAGIDYYKIVNWHLFYNISFQYQTYTRDRDMVRDISSKIYYINPNPDSTSHSSNEYNFDDNLYANRFNLSSNINYQFNSRSIFSILSNFAYIKNDSKHDDDYYRYKSFNESIQLTILPSFRYYLTPKFVVNLGTSLSANKRYYRDKYIYESGNDIRKNSYLYYRAETNISLGYYF